MAAFSLQDQLTHQFSELANGAVGLDPPPVELCKTLQGQQNKTCTISSPLIGDTPEIFVWISGVNLIWSRFPIFFCFWIGLQKLAPLSVLKVETHLPTFPRSMSEPTPTMWRAAERTSASRGLETGRTANPHRACPWITGPHGNVARNSHVSSKSSLVLSNTVYKENREQKAGDTTQI